MSKQYETAAQDLLNVGGDPVAVVAELLREQVLKRVENEKMRRKLDDLGVRCRAPQACLRTSTGTNHRKVGR